MVVDDDEEAAAGLVEALEHAQFQVRAAVNGRAALDALQSGPRPSLILLDLHMPVMNGWEFARLAAADPNLAEIPICMVSGTDNNSPSKMGDIHQMYRGAMIRMIAPHASPIATCHL